jgi:hypothetical protein
VTPGTFGSSNTLRQTLSLGDSILKVVLTHSISSARAVPGAASKSATPARTIVIAGASVRFARILVTPSILSRAISWGAARRMQAIHSLNDPTTLAQFAEDWDFAWSHRSPDRRNIPLQAPTKLSCARYYPRAQPGCSVACGV